MKRFWEQDKLVAVLEAVFWELQNQVNQIGLFRKLTVNMRKLLTVQSDKFLLKYQMAVMKVRCSFKEIHIYIKSN